MNLDFSVEDERFREEARDWLNDNVPRERRPQQGQAMRDFDLAWQRASSTTAAGRGSHGRRSMAAVAFR